MGHRAPTLDPEAPNFDLIASFLTPERPILAPEPLTMAQEPSIRAKASLILDTEHPIMAPEPSILALEPQSWP